MGINIIQERLNAFKTWKEKYNAASDEEKERMLKEREEGRIAAERELKKKIATERKQRFMDRADKQIDLYRQLLEARKIALDVIKSFDGKVLNNRLTKVVEQKLKEFNDALYASLDISYDRELGNNVGKLKIRIRHYLGPWAWDETSLYILLSPVSESNRVIWAETENDERDQDEIILERIKDWEDARNEYDNAIAAADEISKVLEKYGDVNYNLRQFISEEHIIGYTWRVG